jgi:hypothetical protein
MGKLGEVFSRVFRVTPGFSRFIPGFSRFTPGYSGFFQVHSRVFRCFPGPFQGIPCISGYFRVFPAIPGYSGVFQVLENQLEIILGEGGGGSGEAGDLLSWNNLENTGNTRREPGKHWKYPA